MVAHIHNTDVARFRKMTDQELKTELKRLDKSPQERISDTQKLMDLMQLIIEEIERRRI